MKRSTSLLLTGAMSLGTVAVLSVVAPGVASAGTCGTTLIDTQGKFDAAFPVKDTRATGHNEVVDKGLRVWTEGTTSTDKAAAYMPIQGGVPLAGQTAQSNYALPLTNTSNGGVPGYQLVMDFDNNGTDDGILVSESAYGNDWWLSNSAAEFAKAGAPRTGGGSGTNWFGTLDQWSGNFPDADITAFGYSLGSGVKGDVVISNIKFGCNTFAFDLENRGPVAVAEIDDHTDSNYQTYYLSGTKSSDPDRDPLSYSWTVDGVEVSQASEFGYTFPKGRKDYTVALTVSDGKLTNSTTQTVKVTPPADTVSASPLPNTGANVLGMAAVGAVVLAGSGAGMVATRRRRAGNHAA